MLLESAIYTHLKDEVAIGQSDNSGDGVRYDFDFPHQELSATIPG